MANAALAAMKECFAQMAIRFAPARKTACHALSRVLTMPRMGAPANDSALILERDLLLRRALWHFAEHGLAAAAQARTNATRAAARGDREEFHNWLAICQLLDRRMAKALRHGLPG